jgi:GTPase involved in cell partitioning and DNA repair
MLKGLLPNKWVLLAMAALIFVCVFLYQRNETNKATLRTAQTELKQAQKDLAIQTQTILALQRDATVQAQLMQRANAGIAAAREQARKDTQALTQRDLAREANANAQALQTTLNAQFSRLLQNIEAISNRKYE